MIVARASVVGYLTPPGCISIMNCPDLQEKAVNEANQLLAQ